jgi:hypothetical protein
VCCVGTDLCDKLIAHYEESPNARARAFVCVSVCVCVCVSVCDVGTSTLRRPRPDLGCSDTDE